MDHGQEILKDTFPIQYWGPLSYFAELLHSEQPIFEIHETYPRHSYRNKCDLMAANGMVSLSVPVKKPLGSKTKTHEINIDQSQNWAENHLKTIKSAYAKAPYFEYYFDDIKDLLLLNHTKLVDLNFSILEWCNKKIQNDLIINKTEEFQKKYSGSLKNYDQRIPQLPHYFQVFEDKHGFISDLSILDGLFNLGPELKIYLKKII